MYSLFGRFAASGAAFIDATRVRNDIESLKAVIDRVNRYTITVIAHRDAAVAKGATPRDAITCGDLDNAINTIGTVHARYYTLCHPGGSLAILTPFAPLTWVHLFATAWMPAGFRPLDHDTFEPPGLR